MSNIDLLPGNPSYQRPIPLLKRQKGSLYGKKCLKINEHTEVWVDKNKTPAQVKAIR